jgi:hypothetical protein
MRGLLLGFALAFGGIQVASATTTDSLKISSGGLIATIQDNGSCVNVTGTPCTSLSGDTTAAAGTDTISGSINGWTLNIISGTSHSPTFLGFGIDVTSLTASCSSGTCVGTNALHVIFSDINFTIPILAGGFNTTFSANVTGAGTASESAFVDNTNTLFGEPGTGLIATVGPITAPGGISTKSGGPAGVPNYALTLDQVFSGAGSTFSTDSNVTNVPEPASVVLLGGLLLLGASRLRRRKV